MFNSRLEQRIRQLEAEIKSFDRRLDRQEECIREMRHQQRCTHPVSSLSVFFVGNNVWTAKCLSCKQLLEKFSSKKAAKLYELKKVKQYHDELEHELITLGFEKEKGETDDSSI